MSNNLINHIKRYIDLSEEESRTIAYYFKLLTVKKKEYLLSEGQICKNLFFVEEGCLRMYYISNKTTETITQFAIENWWITDYFSFIDNKASDYYIQAIETSKILSLNANDVDSLLNQVPKLEKYFRIVYQRALAAYQFRVKLMTEMTKEEYYYFFSSSFPEFMQRVPQYMIASHLGLTPEYVSELRKKNNSK